MAEIDYPVDANYKDNSKEILIKVLQVEEEGDHDEEDAEEHFYADDDSVAMF